MAQDLKKIKEQIEKLAQVPKRSVGPKAGPTETASFPTRGNKPVPSSSVQTKSYSKSPTNSAIREMQLSMQDLAQAVMQDAESGTMSLKNKDSINPTATEPVKRSKKSFNDFVAEQYMGGLDDDNKGVEWNKDSKVVNYPGKKQTQTDIYELDVVMNTLSRIGAERSELKADGNWDWRTNNALKNMLGFSYALLELEGDFGLNNQVYNIANWNDFKNALSGYRVEGNSIDLPDDEKKIRAVKITKHLKAITKLYNDFRQQVIARPEYRPYLEGKRSFDTYDKNGSNKDALNSNEVELAKTDTKIDGLAYIAPRLPEKRLNYIPLKALNSKSEYLKWMLEVAGVPNEEIAWTIFNKIIKPKIEAL